MNIEEAKSLKAGDRIVYDDGRGPALATVEDIEEGRGMHFWFDDRASVDFTFFTNKEWMDHFTKETI